MIQISPGVQGYFTTMAQISATLLGLSFLALTFYMQGIFDRVKLALPIFRYEDRYQRRAASTRRAALGSGRGTSGPQVIGDSMLDFADASRTGPESIDLLRNPFDLTDLQFFDGDPLVVFLAYSTALSWNLYFLSLVLSVTFTAWNPVPVWAIALESVLFLALMVYDNAARRQQYARLRTYNTHEERLVPVLERIALAIYGLVVVYCWWGAFGWPVPVALVGASTATLLAPLLPQVFVSTLQIIVLLAFCGGLFVTNKDLFIYFKAKISEDMRANWLGEFATAYRSLSERVSAPLLESNASHGDVERLQRLWNEGRPPQNYFPKSNDAPSDSMWQHLIDGEAGKTIAPFMLDVPAIAAWLYDVERSLKDLNDKARYRIGQ